MYTQLTETCILYNTVYGFLHHVCIHSLVYSIALQLYLGSVYIHVYT